MKDVFEFIIGTKERHLWDIFQGCILMNDVFTDAIFYFKFLGMCSIWNGIACRPHFTTHSRLRKRNDTGIYVFICGCVLSLTR